MSWNYRIIHKVTYSRAFGPMHEYSVHEVYYHHDGSIRSWTEKPVSPFGETMEELRDDFEKHQRALFEPVLELDEIERSQKDSS